jgi:ankyrin repeat protein
MNMKNIKGYIEHLKESSNQEELNKGLLDATCKGKLEVVKSLLDRGANVNTGGLSNLTPLHFAANGGNTEIARFLLDRGAQVDAEGEGKQTPLHMAAIRGHTEVARLLLDRGANVNAVNMIKWTPLHETEWHGHTELARLLILRGADPFSAFKDLDDIIKFFKGDISWIPEEVKAKLERRVRSRGAFGRF